MIARGSESLDVRRAPVGDGAALRREALRFLIVGALAAAANFGSRFLFSLVVPFATAIVLAFFVGLTTAFVLNRSWVFVRAQPTTWQGEAVRFTIVNLAGLVLTLGVSLWLADTVLPALGAGRAREAIAHFCGIAATVVTSYVAHKWWTFR
jgi:putative flippase GtrA